MSTKEAERRASQRRMTLTVNETAERLGIGRNQAYEAVRNGQIPAIRIGKRLLVPEAALERLLAGDAA
jgi:excisionase family DNA binding protein